MLYEQKMIAPAAVAASLREATRKNVQTPATHEFHYGQRHVFDLIAAAVSRLMDRFFATNPRLKPGAKCCRSSAAKHSPRQRTKTCAIPGDGNSKFLPPHDNEEGVSRSDCKPVTGILMTPSDCFKPSVLQKFPTAAPHTFYEDVPP